MDKSDKRPASPRETPQQEESKSAGKLDLSVAQVLGSAVAAVIAAFAAGQLGVYGTFLGAGVMSLVATSGGPVFQHFFRKTGEQIKEVTVPPKARQAPVRDPAAGWKEDEGHHTRQALHNAEALHDTGAAATQLLPTAGGTAEDATRVLRSVDATRRPRHDDATRVLGTVRRPPDGADTMDGDEVPGDGEFTEATTHGTKWRGWRRTLLPAVVVFVIAIGGITLYEAISGHSVSGGKGTSLSDVFRPDHGSSTGDTPKAPGVGTDQDGTGNSESPSPTPESSQQSTEPGDRDSRESGKTGSTDTDTTSGPTPDPSHSPSDGTEGSGDGSSSDPGSGDTSGSDSGQDGDGTSSGQSDGAGSGSQLPQGQQPGLSSQG
ncbi:MSCRAMM family adhesin SdrC [Streptomyces sp. 891-h]|uniref:MSCRAMM family adhesin SdrC n=1 Tax=Streptomyces sp. 891-h TaxID=2720714 RepID=UPI001FAA9237|nr:MSCRAMM family adhesin SdrC [Streptomyces sp. 891-h]UNZ16974.1 hypothetical protein HC362_07715 [Streptomyces sp. 891-h]